MSDATEITSTSDDERQLNAFRDRLRDGDISARLHGAWGEPSHGDLKLLEDKVTLVWNRTPLQFNGLLLPRLLQTKMTTNSCSIVLTAVKSVRSGRQTTNFVRTIKCAVQMDSGSFIAPLGTGEEKTYVAASPTRFCRIDDITTGLVAESLAFEHFMNVVVFFNSVLFALEYHGMSESYAARLYMIENFLMLVYGTEFVVIGGAAGGLINYLQNPWNRLDFVLLTIACVEFLLLNFSVLRYTDSYARGIFVLRLFRLVRPFRVTSGLVGAHQVDRQATYGSSLTGIGLST
ncbi:hypothetical protein BBJ29_009379 [Phytophthora kernoviae]|uniref:Ion transport domain-containing protein n=1 Tax=Phytophthora kernoviae TaxID=325452 RepID=A0A3F2RK14_9STRA|nr:hypothetical protein BBJ29_009379 [Phytophthora kernoviae]RLN57336.1 hypothetical protein BBP00_00007547 [Phytophthora kernoviae]